MPTIIDVQSASDIQHFSQPPNTSATKTVSVTFTRNNAANNSIWVWVFLNQSGAGVDNNTPVMVDTRLNSYSRIYTAPPGGSNNGAGCWLFKATGIAAGANTITFSFVAVGGFVTCIFECTVLAVEISGMVSPTLQSANNDGFFGSGGNFPATINITDSHGATVGVTFKTGGATGANGIGTINTGVAVADVLSGGVNYLIAACLGTTNLILNPTTTPSNYATLTQDQLVSDIANGYYGYLWTPGTISQRSMLVWVIT